MNLDALAERLPGGLAQGLLLAVWLATLVVLVLLPPQITSGVRENHLAMLGHVLPEAIWQVRAVYDVSLALFVAGGALWWLRIRPVASSVVTVLALWMLGSWRAQGEMYSRHQLYVPFLTLLVLAGWTVLCRRELAEVDASEEDGALYRARVVPVWVPWSVLVLVGWGYTTSGLEKLAAGGVAWGDGVSLRVWLTALAPEHPLTHVFTASPALAAIAQSLVLWGEVFAVVGLAWRPLRPWFGLVLLGFHASLEWTLGLRFLGNEVVLLLLAVVWPVWSHLRSRTSAS